MTRQLPSLSRKLLWIRNLLWIFPLIGSNDGTPFFELSYSARLVDFLTSLSLAWIAAITSCHPWPGLPHVILAPWYSVHCCELRRMLKSCRSLISLACCIFLVPPPDPLFIERNDGQHTEEDLPIPLCPWMPRKDIRKCEPVYSLLDHTSRTNSIIRRWRIQPCRTWFYPTRGSPCVHFGFDSAL